MTPGHSYEYRLGIDQPPSGQLLTCPVTVDVPFEVVRLSLGRARPNPSPGDIIVTFQLPSGAPATLRLYDLTGREIHSVDVGALGPGRPTVNLGAGLSLRPGLYFVRLSQGGADATTRVTLFK